MRKKCLLFLLCMLTTAVVFAGKESSYVLYEGFEDGVVPATWTQEYISDMQVPWAVEQTGTSAFPEKAFEGNGYVALRNATGQTQYFTTMLVTPVIDLSNVFQPILIFSRVQMQYAGDVDLLRIWYRTSAESRWVELEQFNTKTVGWETDTVALTAPTATYQLAFEGVDQMGRGIALDEVIVRPTPTCDDPSNITADGLTSSSVTLRWNGSLDTDSFNIVLSTTQQTDPTTPVDIVKNEFSNEFQWVAEGLERNTLYYVYIQAYCGSSVSEWTEFSFRTKNLATIPYEQTFDKEYVQGYVSHVDYWTHGTSILKDDGSMAFMPFVNQHISVGSLKQYSYSQTTALVFAGANSTSTDIPAGHYVYAATPEMDVDNVSNLQAMFWGTCYDYVGADYMSGLVVGVMTDPADFSTFVPVDTVYAKESRTYERFIVSFDSYKGEGKYIAFASNFMEKNNIFYMDDLTISEAPALRDVTNIEVLNRRGARFDITADLNGNAQVQLIVARDTTDIKTGSIFFDPLQLPAEYHFVNKVLNASDFPYTVELPQGGCLTQVYMRPTDGTNFGNFTLPFKVLVPMKWEEGMLVTFENTETKTWQPQQLSNFTQSTNSYTFPFTVISTPQNFCSTVPSYPFPYSTTGGGYESNGHIIMGKELQEFAENSIRCKQEIGDYIALPEVERIDSMAINFYMKGYSESYTDISSVAVGVMTDPFDPTTFDTVAICNQPESTWAPFMVSFLDYKGKGRFPAIMVVDAKNKYHYSSTSGSGGSYKTYKTSYLRLDNVFLEKIGACVIPSNIEAVPSHNEVEITWKANNMTQWAVNLYADADATNKIDSAIVSQPSHKFVGLDPHTTYYYGVSTVCEDDVTEAFIYKFTTNCLPAESLPYIVDFEDWVGSSSDRTILPNCWTIPRFVYTYSSSSSYYPYVYNTASYAFDGTKSLYFTYGSASSSATHDVYAALPLMNDTLNELQLQFYAKPGGSAYVGDTLYVGVMTDPNDISTFDTVSICRLTENAYIEFIVRFDTYKGEGQYIAFMSPQAKASRSVYIDAVKVDYLSDCEKIQGVTARNATMSGADVYWQKANATTWNVLLTTDTMTLGSIVEVDGEKVLSIDTTTTMPFHIDNCPTPNEQYYVYVRAVCDEDNLGEWSRPATFKTTCIPVSAGDLGVIDFTNKDELDCWTVGVREGTTAKPSRNTNSYLYMFNSATSDGAYAIMPPLDVDSINRLQVSFDAHGGTGAAYLRELTVGVISNPSDLSTFVAVKKISLNKVSATSAATGYGFNEAARYTIRFDKYYGDYNGDFGKQIMFISESGDLANYVYIKNIKVDTIGSCMEPVELNVVETNTYDATIAWENIAPAYQVQLLAEDKEQIVADTIVTDTASVKLTNLEMLTTYYAQVRAICAEGDTSIWSNMIALKTVCPVAYPLPYSMDFEDYATGAGNLPDCWEGYTNSSTKYPYVYSTAKKDGARGFYLYRTTSYSSYAVLPKFDAKISALMLSFDYRNASTSNNAYFVVGIATDITSMEGIDSTLTVIDSVEIVKYASPNNVWNYYSKTLDAYTGPDGYVVLIAPKADATANNGAIYIDNVYVEKAPTCFRPINFELVTTSATTATLTWEPFGKETAWDIAYVLKDEDIANATIVTLDSTKTTITGLQHSTEYDFYVRANCGEGDVSGWSKALTMSTLYLVELADANWNFDDYTTQYQSPLSTSATYKNENGWIVGNKKSPTSVSYVPYNKKNTYNSTTGILNYHYAKSDSCAMYLYSSTANNGAYAIIPEINANYDSLQLRFYGRALYATSSKVENRDSIYTVTYAQGSYPHAVKVGTLTDPYDLSTFELLTDYTFQPVTDKNVVEGGHWEEVIVPLYGAKGKYIVFLSEYDATNQVYIDDVVVEKETGCNMPTLITTENLTYESATFTWKSSKSKWQVKLIDVETNGVLETDTVETSSWSTNQLQSTTEYIFSVSAICAENETSSWSSTSFMTPCKPVDDYTNFVVDFETNLIGNLPECWEEGKLTVNGTSTSYITKVINNTTSYQYSRNRKEDNTEAAALRLYNYSTTYTNSYVVLPEMTFDLDSVSLHFWARAAYFFISDHKTATNRARLYTANNNYQKTIVIGAIANVEDPTTFVPLDTFTYSQSWSATAGVYAYNDETGNEYWEEVLIPLKEYKDKGRIAIFYPDNGKTSYFFIDDMEIVPGDFCSSATNLRVTNLTSNSATLNWVILGNDSVQLQLAYNDEFNEEELLLDTTLVNAGGKFELTGLESGRDYYFRVQHFCSEEETAEWATSGLFVTDYAVRFFEDFSELRTYPVDWSRANSVPEKIFSGEAELNYVAESITANWKRSGCVFADNAISAATSTGTSSTNNYWLLTPVIDLTQLEDSALMLSFEMGLSASGSAESMPNATLEDDKFIVAVSVDAGDTWSQTNTTYWSDAEGDNAAFSYAKIPHMGQLYNVDMTQYIGKRIKIAFINSSTKTNSRNTIYLTNVSLNSIEIENYEATICQWTDYADENFVIDAYDLNPGETSVYQSYVQARNNSEIDKFTTLTLNVVEDTETTILATICEGEDYMDNNFNILNASKSAIYKQKLQGVNGCDSVVELNLTVLPRLRSEVTQTICQGDFFEFNGVKYYTNTVKSDTLTSLVTGCDSIVTLYLTVNAILEGDSEEHLCPGGAVEFGKFGTITEPGIYVDTLKNALGCDSVATLSVFVHDNVATTVRAAICQGESYSEDVWAGLTKAGDYPSKQETIWGCDSIVTLHLMVADANKTIYDNITSADLPYVLNGEELLPVGTTDGTYTKLIDLSCGTITAVITVGKVTNVNSVYQNSLALAPNLVTVGQETNVYGSFDEDAVLEVYHTTGALVYRSANTNVVPGLPTAGVYMVTVKSNNQVFQSMLIVQ